MTFAAVLGHGPTRSACAQETGGCNVHHYPTGGWTQLSGTSSSAAFVNVAFDDTATSSSQIGSWSANNSITIQTGVTSPVGNFPGADNYEAIPNHSYTQFAGAGGSHWLCPVRYRARFAETQGGAGYFPPANNPPANNYWYVSLAGSGSYAGLDHDYNPAYRCVYSTVETVSDTEDQLDCFMTGLGGGGGEGPPGGLGGDDTPVIVDVAGDGVKLSSPADGVVFDLGSGAARYSWTLAGSDDAFLVLDRDGDGSVSGARELFGGAVPQAEYEGEEPNGFLALREFDTNGDWIIDSADPAFSRLLLWRDVNHDGASQPGELSPLTAAGVSALGTDYRTRRKKDEHGNLFRYVSFIERDDKHRRLFDIILRRA